MNKKKKDKDWFKDRGYLHFTNRIPIDKRSSVLKYILDPKNIAQHSFSPLILKHIKQRRFKKSEFNGLSRRSHKTIEDGAYISNTKVRDIMYATHIDAHIYSYYTQKRLYPLYNDYLNSKNILTASVTAYRQIPSDNGKGYKNNVHFAKDAFDEIKSRENCVALTFDIKNFFPSLDHKHLKKMWCNLLKTKSLPKDHYNLFKAVTNFSYVKQKDLRTVKGHFDEKKIAQNKKNGKQTFFYSLKELFESGIQIYKNENRKKGDICGIPQGLPISAMLANLYMLPFDEEIIEKFVKTKGVFYRRYSDDIIVICNPKDREKVEAFIYEEIKKIKLKISPEKTERYLFSQGEDRLTCSKMINNKWIENIPLTYLGFEFYGYQTLIKSKNLSAFYREMKETIHRKANRVNSVKSKYLLDEAPIFKRKIYRLYSYKGIKKRKLQKGKQTRIFRGNYIKYAYRAAEEMNAPEIKKQLHNHWKILQSTLHNHDFSNINKNQE